MWFGTYKGYFVIGKIYFKSELGYTVLFGEFNTLAFASPEIEERHPEVVCI